MTSEINYKNTIVQYNIDDCEALYAVKKWIANIEDSLNNENHESFAKISDLPSVSYLKWGKPRFQIPEFEKINNYEIIIQMFLQYRNDS